MDKAITEKPKQKKEPEMKGVSFIESEQKSENPWASRSIQNKFENLIANTLPPRHGSNLDNALWLGGNVIPGIGGLIANKVLGGERGAISRNLAKWLKSAGIDGDTSGKLVKINEDIQKNDIPGEILKDKRGNILFSSNNQAAHIIRQAIASDKFARQYADNIHVNLNNDQLRDNVTIGLLHDIGKTRTPKDTLNRPKNFPPEGMTYADMQDISYEPGNLGQMMNAVLKRNPELNIEYVRKFGGLANPDFNALRNHVGNSDKMALEYGVDPNMTAKANMHHIHYKDDAVRPKNYPPEYSHLSEKEIPIEARIQSMFDAGDASVSPRYGVPAPEDYDAFMTKLSYQFPGGPPSIGTQFDPDLFALARDGGHFKNYFDNIANKEGYSLGKTIKKHRIDTYGKDNIDELTPERLDALYRIMLSNTVNRRD